MKLNGGGRRGYLRPSETIDTQAEVSEAEEQDNLIEQEEEEEVMGDTTRCP